MRELISLAGLLLAGLGLLVLAWWVERVTRRPGLASYLGAFLLLIVAAAGLAAGRRLLPALFIVQAAIAINMGRLKRSMSRPQGNGP